MLRGILNVRPEDYERVADALFAYLFKRIDMRQLQTYVGEYFDHLHDLIESRGDLLRDYKLYIHNHWCALRDGTPLPRPQDFFVTKRDAKFLQRMKLKHVPRKYGAMTIPQLEALIAAEVYGPDIEAYIGRYINKKMLFLVRSFSIPRHDLKSQMQIAAMRGIYKQYPFFESHLYFRNFIKNLIKKEGQNLISYHTRQSRTRLVKNEEGVHQQVHVSMDAVFDVEYEPSVSSEVRDMIVSLTQLSVRMKPRVQRFLLLAAGQHDEAFSQYLKLDNSEAIERWPYERYMAKVQKFCEVTPEQVQALFVKLRPHLR